MPPPTTATTRPTPYHHGGLADALVVAALRRVREAGSASLSLRAVAQEVGVSPSAAYHHFPDKDALLHEVAHRGGDLLDERVGTAVAAVRGDDERSLVRRMRAIGEAYIDFAVQEPNLFRHTFGPLCAAEVHLAHEQAAAAGPGAPPTGKDSGHVYRLLCRTLDAMDSAGMLRQREGVDLLAWTVVHGLSCLLVDGLVPLQARDLVLYSVLANAMADPSRLPELLAD